MKKLKYISRCVLLFCCLMAAFITCTSSARAAFVVHTSPTAIGATASPINNVAIAIDTTKVADGSPFHRTPHQIRNYQRLAVVSGILAIGCFTAAVITATPAFLVGWFILAFVSLISALSNNKNEKRKITPAQLIAGIAFAPVVIGVAAFYAAAYLIFALPAMLTRKLRIGELRQRRRTKKHNH